MAPCSCTSDRRPRALINVYVDFDGTIAPDEPTDQLFERFADPAWRAIDEAWLAGRMTSWDATAQKVALLRASPEEIHDFLRTMSIDPCFADFVDLCRSHGIGLTVVSDGLDLVLRTVLAAAGLILPCKANQLVWRGGDRWAAAFPHRSSGCSFRLGNCKCAHRQPGAALDVMVGDGRSDFCIAQHCQLVIAKGIAAATLPGAAAAPHRHARLRRCQRSVRGVAFRRAHTCQRPQTHAGGGGPEHLTTHTRSRAQRDDQPANQQRGSKLLLRSGHAPERCCCTASAARRSRCAPSPSHWRAPA